MRSSERDFGIYFEVHPVNTASVAPSWIIQSEPARRACFHACYVDEIYGRHMFPFALEIHFNNGPDEAGRVRHRSMA